MGESGLAAHWALLGPGAELRTTSCDPGGAVARIAAECAYEGAAEWAEYVLHSRASGQEAWETFGPLDGRGRDG